MNASPFSRSGGTPLLIWLRGLPAESAGTLVLGGLETPGAEEWPLSPCCGRSCARVRPALGPVFTCSLCGAYVAMERMRRRPLGERRRKRVGLLARLVPVFREARRVLREEGQLEFNAGPWPAHWIGQAWEEALPDEGEEPILLPERDWLY